MGMTRKMMSSPFLDWTGIEVKVKQENTCDFEEKEMEEDVFNYL